MFLHRVLLVPVLCLMLACSAAAASSVSRDIAALEQVLEPASPSAIRQALRNHEAALFAPEFVSELYAQRLARPVWTDAASIVTLRAGLRASRADGLHEDELRRSPDQDPFDPNASLRAAEREILLTDTLVALGNRLVNGRADPRGLTPGNDVPLKWQDHDVRFMQELSVSLDAGDIAAVIEGMRPTSKLYVRLRDALSQRLDTGELQDVETLRVNLERARWFDRLLGEQDRVVVNIPAFTVSLHLDGESVWQTRAIVGKHDRRTPVFVSNMRDIVLDPTWTVPRSIIEERLFDEARTDPEAFAARGFRFRDVRGRWHEATDIAWERYTGSTLPYDIVQMPGDQNALGRMKFMFDNPYSVYLHDTPSRGLFDKESRAFSHGCVRVDNPDELARLILGDRGGLDQLGIESLQADSDNIAVDLLEPLAVALLYWTVDVDENGALIHHEDIYQRDDVIRKAINTIDPPVVLRRTRGS